MMATVMKLFVFKDKPIDMASGEYRTRCKIILLIELRDETFCSVNIVWGQITSTKCFFVQVFRFTFRLTLEIKSKATTLGILEYQKIQTP